MIWISRVSNLVRRMARAYRAALGAAIAALCFWTAAPSQAAEGARLCVLVPHFKDEYWLSVAYGLEQEAAREGAQLFFFEAGGYRARDAQIAQLASCATQEVDAILIGAVTSDHPELIEAIADVAETIPVIGLVNALHSDALSARIGVDWRDMGAAVGRHLSALHPERSPGRTAVLISGPPEAGWPGPLEEGLRRELGRSAVEIVGVYSDDTGLRQQLRQAEAALEAHPHVDYVIGSAPAIEATIGYLAARPDRDKPGLIATYVNHTIKRSLMNGNVIAAPFDDPARQGKMALRQAMSVISGHAAARSTGPDIVFLTDADSDLERIPVSPPEYFPDIR